MPNFTFSTAMRQKLKLSVEQSCGVQALREVEFRGGNTWNDGGSWYTGIYQVSEGHFVKAHMASDYLPDDIAVTKVERRETIVVTYD